MGKLYRVFCFKLQKQKNQIDIVLGIDYQLDCGESLGLELERNFTTNKVRTSVEYKVILDLPQSYKAEDCFYQLYEQSTQGLLYRPVKRTKEFRLEKKRKNPQSTNSQPIDISAPVLATQRQTVEKGQSLSYQPQISNLDPPDERIFVKVNTLASAEAPSLSWNPVNNSFLIDATSSSVDSSRNYTYAGIIRDQNGNQNVWSLIVSVIKPTSLQSSAIDSTPTPDPTPDSIPAPVATPVPASEPQIQNREVDTQAPTLTAQDQTVTKGQSLNYSPTIGNLRANENYSVRVNALSSNAPTVTWDQTNRRFTISASSAQAGQYSVSGTIQGANNNSSSWSFKVSVVESDTQAPTLTAQDQIITLGMVINLSPTIGNLRSGEAYSVTINSLSSGAPTVTWDQTNRRFTISASSAQAGQYSVSGTIQGANNNSSSWSFKVIVDVASGE